MLRLRRPTPAIKNSGNGSSGYPVLRSNINLSLRSTNCSNFIHLILGQFGFSAPVRIDARGNRLQMVGIHAPRIAAKVVNDEAVRNWPTMSLIDDAVSETASLASIPADKSVPTAILSTLPFPAASFGIDNVFNEIRPQVMPKHKALVMPFKMSLLPLCFVGNRGGLSTSAHAKPGRIGRLWTDRSLSREAIKTFLARLSPSVASLREFAPRQLSLTCFADKERLLLTHMSIIAQRCDFVQVTTP